jgi:hypothetical protein
MFDDVFKPMKPIVPSTSRGGRAVEKVRFRSVGAEWRWWRNVAICKLIEGGMSQRRVAMIFDLPRSSIGTIWRRYTKR